MPETKHPKEFDLVVSKEKISIEADRFVSNERSSKELFARGEASSEDFRRFAGDEPVIQSEHVHLANRPQTGLGPSDEKDSGPSLD